MSDSRVLILDVAEALFMRQGYDMVSLKDIAQTLKMKQPSLYYHFPDGKEEIYYEVTKRALNRFKMELEETISSANGDISDQLIQVGLYAIDNMIMSPVVMFRLDFPKLSSKERIMQLSMSAYNSIFSPLNRMIENAQSRNEILDHDPDVIAGLILSALEGINQGVTWQQRDRKEEIWRELVHILLRGLLIDNA